MDGVLIDSMSGHVHSWKKALEEVGLRVNESDLYKLGGFSFKETILWFAKKNKKQVSEEEIQNIYLKKRKYFSESNSSIKTYKINSKLKNLKKSGVTLYVVTSSPSDFSVPIIEKFFPNIFASIISIDDVVNGKPKPDPYLKALEISGFKKEECIVVEDAPLGVESAKNAGMKVFALTTSVSKEYLFNADKVFGSHENLFNYIKSNLL